jgi:hypothetical protein
MKKKALFNTLNSLKVGTIIKAEFPNKEEFYIVNDKNNFCQLQITEYGVILKNEHNIDDMYSYFCSENVGEIKMYDKKELTEIKTVLLEIFFGITRYENGADNIKEISNKVIKLKKLLNS